MTLDGRPDGTRPFDCESLLDHYHDQLRRAEPIPKLSDDDWEALDTEIMQYYHRRIGLLATASEAHAGDDDACARSCYGRAGRDAAHNLAIMDFIRDYADDEAYVAAHEHYRPFVLYHRTLADSQRKSLSDQPEEAVECVKDAITALQELPHSDDEQKEEAGYDVESSLRALKQLDRELRRRHGIDRTLAEQLEDAIDREDFEQAAVLRDRIRRRNE